MSVVLFWAMACAMIVMVALYFARAVLGGKRLTDTDRRAQNLTTARRNLEMLQQDLAAGTLAVGQLDELRTDIENQAVNELGDDERQAVAKQRPYLLIIVVAVVLPILVGGIYLRIGAPHLIARPSVTEFVAGLEAQLAQQPDDITAWRLLVKLQVNRGDFAAAAAALKQIRALEGDTADNLIAVAELGLLRQQGQYDAAIIDLLRQAIATQPQHPRALIMLGYAARDAGDLPAVRRYWTNALAVLDPTSRVLLEQELAALRITDAPATASVQVLVRIDENLLAQVKPDSVLYVLARDAATPGAPLAVWRGSPRDLPTKVTLGVMDAMVPGNDLSTTDQVIIVARIAQDGQPHAQSGDLQGEVANVTTNSGVVTVTIEVVLS